MEVEMQLDDGKAL